MRSISVFPLLMLVALTVVPFSGPALAEDAPDRLVPAVIYEVFHGDSIHNMGRHVREIHVPSRDLGFYVDWGELRVFRAGERRYGLPGDMVDLGSLGEENLRVPLMFLPGQETRRVGETRLPLAFVERLSKLLDDKTGLQGPAEGYLQGGSGQETVATFEVGIAAAASRVADALDQAGILWSSQLKDGVVTVRVPVNRAEEARLLLLAANPKTGYRVLYADGWVVWELERTMIPPTPPDTDVLLHLACFPGSMTVEDGRKPKYGDADLEAAEKTLADRLPRPWTVAALRAAYAEAEPGDGAYRAALITLLAASRHPDVLPLVGAALGDEDLDVRVAATTGILAYWDPGPLSPVGNLETMMTRAAEWWEARQK